MSAEFMGPDFADPASAIELRNAYVRYFGAIAHMGASTQVIADVTEASSDIRRSGAPLAEKAESAARAFTNYWYGRFSSTEDAGVCILEDPARGALEPMMQSWVFSGLAIQGELVLDAAHMFGKDTAWVKSVTDAWQRDFEELYWGGRQLPQAEIDRLSSYSISLYDQLERRRKHADRSHKREIREQRRQQKREGIV